MKYHNKLVRDKIPDILHQRNVDFRIQIVGDTPEMDARLRLKLIEETSEVVQAKENLLEEMADVYSVLKALARHHSVKMSDVLLASNKKDQSTGAFDNGIVLLWTNE